MAKQGKWMISNACTCTGPYAILIMLGIKRVENRADRPVPEKGRCAVSCSKKFNASEYGNFIQWASRALPPKDFARIPSWADVKDWPGKVVGACDYSVELIADAPSDSDRRPWNEGYDYWWNLSEIVCFDHPIPCRGNVGMWQMPPELAAKVMTVDSLTQCVGTKIVTQEDAARLFGKALPIVGSREGLFVLPLDAEHCAISEPVLVSHGDPNTTVVLPREVFATAFKAEAAAVILAHNHPSGDLTSSVQDRQLTEVLSKMGTALGVPVLDHLVLSGDKWCSCMRDN